MAEKVGQASGLPSTWQAGSLPHVGSALLAIALTFLLPGLAWGRSKQVSQSYGDIQIVADPEPEGEATHGYIEYTFTVTNNSSQSHTVTLTLPAETGSAYGDHFRAISRSVEVAPKSNVRVSIYQPSSPVLGGNDVAVRIDDTLQGRTLPLNLRRQDRFMRKDGGGSLVLVLSPGRERLEFGGRSIPGRLDGEGKEALPGSLEAWTSGAEFIHSDAPLRDASRNWLSYSRYDGVIVLATDLEKMPAPAQTALWQYTECGGSLLVLGKGHMPESWPFGERNEQLSFTHYRPGFGHCTVVENANGNAWRDGTVWTTLATEGRRTASPWGQPLSTLQANKLFPVVKDIGIPVRGLFALLVCFSIVIGPVNLGLLARWKRRIWLLWTVPLLSALTCAVVFGYMILVEGWSGHQRTEAITILDQSSGRAATIGWTGFYSPVTPGDGLRFDNDTELSLQIAVDYYEYGRYERGGKPFQLDWSAGQHLSKGWVTARVPTHFKLRKSELRRERITWTENAGTFRITNGLGVGIKKLWLADGSGRLHTAGPVEPGATAILAPTRARVAMRSEEGSLRQLYASDWLTEGRRLRATPERYLFPRTYLADVEGTPFVEDGLRGAEKENSSSLVVGILKGGRP